MKKITAPSASLSLADPGASRGPGRVARLAPALTDAEIEAKLRVLQAAAVTKNTRRTYSSAVQQFLNWGGLLPADEDAVLRYLASHDEVLNPRTLSHRLSALSKWHIHQGFYDPTGAPAVRAALSGAFKLHGKPKKQARALSLASLKQMVMALTMDMSLAAVRDNALLQVGFLGAFRRSELVGILVEDLLWEPEGLTIVLQRSKTDQTGQGVLRSIPYGGQDSLCGPTALRDWLRKSGITNGPVFRPMTRHGTVRKQALGAGSVTSILVLRAERAGLDQVPEFSAHSLRRGMATAASKAGASRRAIKNQGGWKTDAVVDGYIEDAGRFEDNAAGVLTGRR
ncbi:site-specific integrase [Duganella sp. LjRoot269]|uniref:site-specific integrase n=1 Tax=Duganella sp. LjRoot269 TaxID=3342305 RepID=UPI003ED04723